MFYFVTTSVRLLRSPCLPRHRQCGFVVILRVNPGSQAACREALENVWRPRCKHTPIAVIDISSGWVLEKAGRVRMREWICTLLGVDFSFRRSVDATRVVCTNVRNWGGDYRRELFQWKTFNSCLRNALRLWRSSQKCVYLVDFVSFQRQNASSISLPTPNFSALRDLPVSRGSSVYLVIMFFM